MVGAVHPDGALDGEEVEALEHGKFELGQGERVRGGAGTRIYGSRGP